MIAKKEPVIEVSG